ncbi:hypothetical protein SteCoe_14511 [Stentor coeruleus]|uniref:Uncharacterized protein n=1 Tax=Stentor coeruleus TaxID=5963 RepID=A0A1R2C5Q8_9CILI|nr:hypothetical protein SteCoe_14511 [Stentor coeruleus]
MRKDFEYFVNPTLNLRLNGRLSFKESKYTASGQEILSDLEKLKYFSVNLAEIKENINTSLVQVPCKRRRSGKNQKTQTESPENEAVSALTILMLCKNQKKLRKNSIETGNSSEENFYKCKFQSTGSTDPVQTKKSLNYCRNTCKTALCPIDSNANVMKRPKNHVEIAWMNQRLKMSM